MLAVKSNEPLWIDTEDMARRRMAARDLAQEIPANQWQRMSAGRGQQRAPSPRLGMGINPARV